MDPVVYSPLAKEYNLHISSLEQVYGEYSELHHSKHKVLLTCNYRTHNDILKLPSKFFYRDKLRSCDTVKKHPDFTPLMFLKLDDNEDDKEKYLSEFQSYLNVKEANKIVTFLKEELIPTWPVTEWGQLKDNSIGILTTEYAQVRMYDNPKFNAKFIAILSLGTLYPHMFERTNAKSICGHDY